jgi:hypothetical protein
MKIVNKLKKLFENKIQSKKSGEFDLSFSMNKTTYNWIKEVEEKANKPIEKLLIGGLFLMEKACENNIDSIVFLDKDGNVVRKIQ